MRLEVRDFHSADIQEVWRWNPPSPDAVYFQLEIEIGEEGKAGGHLFQLVAATPEGLLAIGRRYPARGFPDRALLVFSEYRWEALVERVERIVTRCTRSTWDESVLCLQRYFEWEYEDYELHRGNS